MHNYSTKFMQVSKLSQALVTLRKEELKFYIKFCCNYLPVHVSSHRNYNWTICEESLLSRLSKIIFIQYENL